jgi:hypothetical protein
MKVREAAANGIGAMSTGEALASALVLNRSDWLASMGYTIAQALDRIDDEWVAFIPQAARMVAAADAVLADAKEAARDESALFDVSSPDEVDVSVRLVTYGFAPGYRDTSLTFDLQRPGSPKTHRVCLRISPDDGESVVSHILETHRWAWRNGTPIDRKNDEQRPRWIDNP